MEENVIFNTLNDDNTIYSTVNNFYAEFRSPIFQPLTCGDRVISVKVGQYHGCWCPGSFRRQDKSSHDIDYVELVGLCLT